MSDTNKKLKIAQLVLPWIPLPPPGYAGTERVVYNLTEGLVKKGHDVTLFSVGESKTSAKLEYVFEKAVGLQEDVMKGQKSSFSPLMHVAHCFELQDKFDIIHSHAQFLGLPFGAVAKTPSVHTFHRVFEFKNQDEKDLVMRYGKLNFTSISNAQRIPGINYKATVYNGVDVNIYKPLENPSRSYLFWAGRIIEKKGPHHAIEVAKRVGRSLIIAGKITDVDYFEKEIKPHIDRVKIILKEELTQDQIVELYQNAAVTLFPITWNEPFGLIPAESMACGTPVVSFAAGGAAETIENGQTGYAVDPVLGVDEFADKTKSILNLDQASYEKMSTSGRKHIAENFSVDKMVDEYEKVYRSIISI